jgi:hypothetical protein
VSSELPGILMIKKKTGKSLSIKRAGCSFNKLADIIGPLALERVMPKGALFYVVGKVGISHLTKWLEDRRKLRLEELHRKLFEGLSHDEAEAILCSDKFKVEEYYSMLKNSVDDEEDAKISTYASLYRGILLGKFTNVPLILRSSRELTTYDYNFMKDNCNDGGSFYPEDTHAGFAIERIQVNDEASQSAVQKLMYWGYLVKQYASGGYVGYSKSSLLDEVVKCLSFDDREK